MVFSIGREQIRENAGPYFVESIGKANRAVVVQVQRIVFFVNKGSMAVRPRVSSCEPETEEVRAESSLKDGRAMSEEFINDAIRSWDFIIAQVL